MEWISLAKKTNNDSVIIRSNTASGCKMWLAEYKRPNAHCGIFLADIRDLHLYKNSSLLYGTIIFERSWMTKLKQIGNLKETKMDICLKATNDTRDATTEMTILDVTFNYHPEKPFEMYQPISFTAKGFTSWKR